jgi:hypothetical protein
VAQRWFSTATKETSGGVSTTKPGSTVPGAPTHQVDLVLTRSFVGYMSDAKDLPCKGGKVHVNVHNLRRKRRSCLYQVKLEVQKNH